MRSQSEYEAALEAEADSALSLDVEKRSDVAHLGAEARRRVTKRRNEFTKEITEAWRDGFKKIKEENDEMQRNLAAAHRAVMQGIVERMADMYEGIQK